MISIYKTTVCTILLSSTMFSVQLVLSSTASAAPVCICHFDVKKGKWNCEPKGCWSKPGVPKLGETILPVPRPKIDPRLIIPKKKLIPGDEFKPKRKLIPGDEFKPKKL